MDIGTAVSPNSDVEAWIPSETVFGNRVHEEGIKVQWCPMGRLLI